MELQVKEFTLPEVIEFNYEELKEAIKAKTKYYETLVYSDAQIADAKSDRADLNKFKKALNDERLRREREYLEPFNDFKKKINELISIIDKPVGVIDSQIKAYEEQKKSEKLKAITEFFEGELREDITTIPPDWLKLTQILDNRWLNASVSMAAVKKEIKEKISGIKESLATLSALPEFGFEATEEYKRSLDLNMALNEGRRLAEIQARKAEAERIRAEEEAARKAAEEVRAAAIEAEATAPTACQPAEPVDVWEESEPKRQWVTFSAYLSVEDASKLAAFFMDNKISFKKV